MATFRKPFRRIVPLFCLVISLVLLAGCEGGFAPSLDFESYAGSNLALNIHADQKEGTMGKPVHIRFKVTNTGRVKTGEPEIIELENKPVMDIRVMYAGTDYALWSAQQPANSNLNRLELASGESRTIEFTWIPDERARNQTVTIQGILNWSEDRAAYAPVILPVDYSLAR